MTHQIMMWICLAMVPVAIWFNLAAGMPGLAVIHAAVCLVAALNWRGMGKTDRILADNARKLSDCTRQLAENERQLTELATTNFRRMPLTELLDRHDDSVDGRHPLHPTVMAAACAVLRERLHHGTCGCEGARS